jgi:AAA domain
MQNGNGLQNGNGHAKLPRENMWFSSEEELLADLDRELAELTRQVRESAAWNEQHPNGQATNTRAPAKRFRLLTAAQLNAGQYETRSLIPGVLAAGQPGGIFGAFKSLKTSIAADLLISLASGTPFLGRFPVPEPGRVLFLSGESGLAALQSIARRICAERGLSLDSLENFKLSPDLPRLDRPSDVAALKKLVEDEKPVCVVIDPAYLALGSDQSRNLFAMGSLLHPLAELCESTGCTVLVVHHCKRSSKLGDPATLDDIAWSGFAEFSAQWLLLSRRRPYDPGTGHHELWLSAGSRAGDHGLWELDVDEGVAGVEPTGEPPVFDALGADFGELSRVAKTPTPATRTRAWKTTLRSVTSLQTLTDERWVAAAEDRNQRRRALSFDCQCQRTLEYLSAYPDGRTARSIRDTLGFSGDRINRLLDWLIEKGHVVKTTDKIDWRRPIVTYSRVQIVDLSETAIKSQRVSRADQKVYDVGTGQFVDQKESRASGTSTCLNLEEMRRTLEQRRGQVPTSEAPASHPKPEEPLTACAAPLPEAAPGEGTLPQAAPEVRRDTGRDGTTERETSANTAGDTNATTGRDTVAEKPKCEDPFPPAPVPGTVWWKAARGQGSGQ